MRLCLVRASQQIDFVKNLHLDREWRRAIDRYPEIRHGLAAVQSQYSGLSDEEKSTIQNTVMELVKLEQVVSSAIFQDKNPEDVERYHSVLNEAQTALERLRVNLLQSV